MKTEEQELEWLCCFCGEVIKRTTVDPVKLDISFPDGDGQGLRAHRECVREHLKLHPSLTLDSFDDEMRLANQDLDRIFKTAASLRL